MSEPTYGAASHAENFAGGYGAGRGEEMPASLQADSDRWNAATPRGYRASSVIAQMRPSANGFSDKSYARMLPNGQLLSSGNGSSETSQEGTNDLVFSGARPLESESE